MKKNLFSMWLMLLAILFSVNMEAQMTIGGKKEPEAFSVLELLNKGGLRLPQMTTAERNAFAVRGNDKGEGLTIYNKTTGCVEYWNKARWVSLCEGTSQTSISPDPCVNVPANGTGCDSTFNITDPDCPNGPFSIAITAGSQYASLYDVDESNGSFKIAFMPNETVSTHTVLVRVTSTCTSLYKEFLFSQNGVECNSMSYTAPAISPSSASSLTLCAGGSVYLSVPSNTANLDKLIWTRNGIEVARGVSYYIANQKGKYNISMGAVGCNTNAANERNVTESSTAAPGSISIMASNNGVICGTNAVKLSATGAGSGTVVWFHNGVEGQTGANIDISGDSNVGEWFAAVKDGSCYSKQSNILTITKSAATGQVNVAAGDVLVNGVALNTFSSFCAGGSLNLSIANKLDGVTYTWYNGNDVITTNPYIVPSGQATMSLRMVATDNSGSKCPAEASVIEKNIVSGSTPQQPNITGNATLCDGSTDLTLVPATPGTYTYTWYKDNVKMAETAATITVTTPGSVYSGTVTNTTGCTSTLATKTISSTLSSLPVVSFVTKPATAVFGAKVTLQTAIEFGPATSYTWTADNGAVVTGSGASVSVQLPASGTDGLTVTIKVTAINSCGTSVPAELAIILNNDCPTPVVTAQSAISQNTVANKSVDLKVTASSAVSATYQWYSNTSASTTGGTAISGATTAAYTYTPTAVGTSYLYCVVTNGCAGNKTGTSPVFTVVAAQNPASIPTGTGSLSGKTCFDIAESNDGVSCGALASRLSNKSDFNLTATNTQTYMFTPSGTVSKVRFVYVESYSGHIVQSLTPTVDKSQATNVTGAQTAVLVYKSTLSSGSAGTGDAKGKDATSALSVDIYAIYNDNASGTGTDKTVKLTAKIKDCACCGALISATKWKEFMCHNLGADQSLDPFTPVPGLLGDNYSQGAKTPTATYVSRGWYDTTGAKTASDPCPDGYRVPTYEEWDGVARNNKLSFVGTKDFSGYGGTMLGNNLMFPNASQFNANNVDRGFNYPIMLWSTYANYTIHVASFNSTAASLPVSCTDCKTKIRCISIN
ncbi:hypothetical protein [Flavobacterium sp. DG2-3]|uniref:hypothetical protein n=1 Tax=Flavobacterium sp. DG2-3 TaxID=3068317 RepID=UPI00273DCE31|nr:hypothetical protein [Flavobacterium sp. DG2-3]MDP5201172.1 hypothetical protein [Flavobacterium sp. DG2-3]